MPSFNRIAFYLMGFPVYWYGLLIAVGLVLGALAAMLREERLDVKKDTTLDFLLLALPCAIVGARLYYVVFAWQNYAAHPLSVFNLREGGLAIYGGVIGGMAAALIFSRRRRVPFGALADLCAPGLALGQAIGRWGNFFNQEAYGAAMPEGLRFFPMAVFIEAEGTWHAATFFYESAWCFLVCAALLLLERGRFFRRRGDLFAAYVFLYAAERVVVEGLRTDSLMLGRIRVSQLLSGAAMLGLLVWMLLRERPVTRGRSALFAVCAVLLALLFALIHAGLFAAQAVCALLVVASGAALYRLGARDFQKNKKAVIP